MLDLSNLLLDSSSLPISHCSDFLSVSVVDHCDSSAISLSDNKPPKVIDEETSWCCSWDQRLRFPIVHKDGISAGKNGVRRIKVLSGVVRDRSKKTVVPSKCLEDHVKDWVEKKVESGVPEKECFLPFLVNAPKMAECRICGKFIFSGENVACTVRGCQEPYHLTCVNEKLGFSTSRNFKCPHHACFICKQRGYWRCIRCTVASHSKCAPWSDKVMYLKRQPGRAVCWRHPTDWRLDKKVNLFFPSSDRLDNRADVSLLDEQHEAPTSDVEEIFGRLPLPYIEEEFEIDLNWKDMIENKVEPPPYLHIRRNLYLVKKKREDADADIGCTNCSSDMCSEDCVCRVQSISCSKSCNCSDTCTNRPFRKDKKVKVVKTQSCGWGVEAAELIKKGDFVIEYIGEVIDDALCEKRLWDMKYRGDQNFYMCEIRKDFTIDATFKGNTARFLNHSCDPNCKLEKWDFLMRRSLKVMPTSQVTGQVDGETRVGVFAAQSIKVGEPLTYDYRFVHFGSMVTCCCGARNCQGYLGTKRRADKLDFCLDSKTDTLDFCWGSKRRRSSMTCLEIIHD